MQIGKGRSEHGVCRNVAASTLLIKLLQVSLHRGNIADDAVLRQIGYHLLKDGDGILQRHRIDQQFGLEFANLLQLCEALAVVGKPHALRVAFIDGHLVLKAQQVDKERAHLACT